MLRPSSSRYQRNKGLKVKHALQIGLLLAVSFWLLYQLKHSHDKKKSFNDTNLKLLENVESRHEMLKFGRKDLNGGLQIPISKTAGQDVEAEREDEEVEDVKHEESEDAMTVRGNDDTNEHDQQKLQEELESHDDFENEEDNKWRGREQDKGDKDKEVDDENKKAEIEEESNEIIENPHEAQEAHYNGDNASSAVLKYDIKSDSALEDLSNADEKQKEKSHTNGFFVENKTNATAKFALVQNENGSSTTTEIVLDFPEAHEKQFNGDDAFNAVKVDLMSETENGNIIKSDEKQKEISENNGLEDAHEANNTVEFTPMRKHIVFHPIDEVVQSPLLNVTEMGEKTDELSLSRIENGIPISSILENVPKDGYISLAKPENGTQFNSTLMESSDHVPEGSNMTESNAGMFNSSESNVNPFLGPAEQNMTSKVGIIFDHEQLNVHGNLAGETNHSDTSVRKDEEQTMISSISGAIKKVNQISDTRVLAQETKDDSHTSDVNQNSTTSLLEVKNDLDISFLSQNSTSSILAEEVKNENRISSTPDVILEEVSVKITDSNSAVAQVKETFADLGTLPEIESVGQRTGDAVAE